MPARIPQATWERFFELVRRGQSAASAARSCHISENMAYRKLAELRRRGVEVAPSRSIRPYPKGWKNLSSEAKAAFDDPVLFRLRYFGHPTEPWAAATMIRVVEALESDQREYIIENIAPGVGKTTLAHDLAAWVTVRNRAIRGVFASKNSTNAHRMMRRLRRALERTRPAQAKEDEARHGMAFDAAATLAGDYGLFRPASQVDVWNNDEFVVVQADDTPIEEKEPTWTAFGFGSDVLSMRYDLMLCDDMDDRDTVRTMEVAEGWRAKWDDEIETRLEPRGVLINIQQRVSPLDLSAYNVAKKVPLDVAEAAALSEEELVARNDGAPPMYTHIVYRAHDETRCQPETTHAFDARPWPDGCLLSPKRLPWTDCVRVRATKPRMWALGYQQEDVNPETVLVKPVWIDGGEDTDEETGLTFQAPGCLDPERGIGELPPNAGKVHSIVTVDPSPANWWAIQWWAITRDEHPTVILLDTVKKRMTADEFLSRNPTTGQYLGLADDWQARSARLGVPIGTWIFEINTANRFVIRDSVFAPWQAANFTRLMPHTTGVNKSSPEYGVYMMRDWFRHGRVRLPWAPLARATTRKLTDELTRYPNPGPDDQVMACWFLFTNMRTLATPPAYEQDLDRPSWAAGLDARHLMAVG